MHGYHGPQYHVVDLSGAVDASGDAVVTSPTGQTYIGEVIAILYDGTSLAANNDAVFAAVYTDIGGDEVAETILTITNNSQTHDIIQIREIADDLTGADEDVNDNEAGAQKQLVPIPLLGARLRVTVDEGGVSLDFGAKVLIRL